MFREVRSQTRRLGPFSAVEWCLWIGCVLAAAGAVLVLVLPAGGPNRVSGVALAFGVSAGAQVANALTHRRATWWSVTLYTVAALAILYALILAVSLPLRLAVEGACQPAPAPCPLGFDVPIRSGELNAVYATVLCGVISLVIGFLAAELQFRPRGRVRLDPDPRDTPR
jgi:hypothetical protein